MKEKAENKKPTIEEVLEIRKKLPCGFGKIIEEMIGAQYKKGTINKMFIGARTMAPEVFEAGIKLIKTIDKLKKSI
jgi:hypothetical protein